MSVGVEHTSIGGRWAFAWVDHVDVAFAGVIRAGIWYQPNTPPVTVTRPYDASLK